MRCRAAVLVGLLALAACNDSPSVPLQGDWVVTTLRDLPGDLEPVFVDLNENGHALWHENGQAFLWDNGEVLEVPVGKFLGSSGEVLGDARLWRDGELIELPGQTRGILEDGTIYLSRNDTMFTWREGTLTDTDRPVGYVGPEGRIWESRRNPDEDPLLMYDGYECGFYQNGEWHRVLLAGACQVSLVEEGGWAILSWSGGTNPGSYVFGPQGVYGIGARDQPFNQAHIVHVNSQGRSVTEDGFLARDFDDKTDLWEQFDSIRPGAINDDGEILAQFRGRVILLTPVSR